MTTSVDTCSFPPSKSCPALPKTYSIRVSNMSLHFNTGPPFAAPIPAFDEGVCSIVMMNDTVNPSANRQGSGRRMIAVCASSAAAKLRALALKCFQVIVAATLATTRTCASKPSSKTPRTMWQPQVWTAVPPLPVRKTPRALSHKLPGPPPGRPGESRSTTGIAAPGG